MNNLKKLISIFLLTVLLGGKLLAPITVFAEESAVNETTVAQQVQPEAPTAPTAPSSPEAPKAPEAPSAPTAPTAPSSPEAPKAPEAPKLPSAPKPPTQYSTQYSGWKPKGSASYTTTENAEQTQAKESESGGNVGDTAIVSGNAINNSTTTILGNQNLATGTGSGSGSSSVLNSGNSSGSNNNGSSTTVNNNTTNQTNSASVSNNLDQSAISGNNKNSYNVGNSSIATGDANVTGTVITAVNTNVDGVMVSEFNIVDDHIGDIILDFNANCIQGCGGQSIAQNIGNGAGSENTAKTDTITNNTTNQTNNANVSSALNLTADSGDNSASFNTGGDSTITTGDANVSANVVTFANNNLAGNVIFGVVNIFGDLIGDIILTQEMLNSLCGGTCGGSATAVNSGNGAGSENTANASNTYNNNSFQSNDAIINNNLVLDANTGGNTTNYNTGGNSDIKTGDSSIDINVLNIANVNLNGGTYWLVLVNHAGNWIGQLMGGPEGSNIAGSPIMEFLIDPITGAITAMTKGNGAGSENTANANNTTNNTINQTNTAVINNDLNLTANTGNNKSSFNTGGDSNIVTGDANIIANIINFVNNNIVGNGTLVVTLINVFGSWAGDFIGPGQNKASKQTQTAHIGGSQAENNNNNSSNNSSNNPKNGMVAGTSSESKFYKSETNMDTAKALTAGVFAKVEKVQSLVKSVSSTANDAKSKIDINLAYGILLLPFVPLIIFRRKLKNIAKILHR